jgi:hypothetical protein
LAKLARPFFQARYLTSAFEHSEQLALHHTSCGELDATQRYRFQIILRRLWAPSSVHSSPLFGSAQPCAAHILRLRLRWSSFALRYGCITMNITRRGGSQKTLLVAPSGRASVIARPPCGLGLAFFLSTGEERGDPPQVQGWAVGSLGSGLPVTLVLGSPSLNHR